MDWMKPGMAFLCGGIIVCFLTVFDIVTMVNVNYNHTQVLAAVQAIRDDINQEKIDRLLMEGMEAQLKAIDQEASGD